jgi:hypothetical protein
MQGKMGAGYTSTPMVTALAYYAMFTGLYEAIFFFTYRGLAQLAFRNDYMLGYFVVEGLDRVRGSLAIGAALGVVSFVIGWGVSKRREWARRAWIIFIYLMFAINVVRFLISSEINSRLVIFIVVRGALVALFTWILMRKSACDEFAGTGKPVVSGT